MESVSLSATPTTFGIDKIRVHTNDFHLRKLDLEKGWEGKPSRIKPIVTGKQIPYDIQIWNP